MVTRVDRKPIVYNTTLVRLLRPAVVTSNNKLASRILKICVGHAIPDISPRELVDDYEDIEFAFKTMGVDDPIYYGSMGYSEDDDDFCVKMARACLSKGQTLRQALRSSVMLEHVAKIQSMLISQTDQLYVGTEAVYKLYNYALWGHVFTPKTTPDYTKWVSEAAQKILLLQSAYLLIHPIAVHDMAAKMDKDFDYRVWHAWNMFKQIETIALRIGSRKGMLAHAYYAGVSRKGFEPAKDPLSDFEVPLTGYCEAHEHVKLYVIMGIRYYKIGGAVCALTHDDCVNLASMAQCYYRTALYFTRSNGYPPRASQNATNLIMDISMHCSRLIDARKNFSHIIRSMHILSQGEFNDMFEEEMGTDLGWRERSANYVEEARTLDPMGATFHKRATDLAVDSIDKLNTCFIYHAFVGDEMLLPDLRNKVAHMADKVRAADPYEWASFMKFVKAYTLCRYMLVNKKKPKCRGNTGLLNEAWAERCVAGKFTMPPHSQWGEVHIYGEMRYTEFADTWHLEAQDVAYVAKDSAGILSSKYIQDPKSHSELLMAMAHGNILDPITGSTPVSARTRIMSGAHVSEVVLTSAPKAENAKPTWKKRVTFAADCEFRKMQAEFDRNCRKVMSFVRGPSLGVDQCILEKQFADIADASALGLDGAICSHDISAWSESMDRARKFEFEELIIGMFDRPNMINIRNDWDKIVGLVTKQGCKDVYKIDNGSFQGFDGSSSTILHSLILIYCIDTARRKGIMPVEVKTNMATLIDDCIAFMMDLTNRNQARLFWDHLKVTYDALGFEVDDLKSIFSTIKAIYLSRRFIIGGEVPADLKVFIKAHSSYEDPLRCTLDVPSDIFGANRGACDANGEPWYIYYSACYSVLSELAHAHPCIKAIPPSAAAVFALAPVVENGWGFPSIMSWATNDITDKRSHFNAILSANAEHSNASADFIRGIDVWPKPVAKAVYAIKSQAWRLVSESNIFTNPFEAIREGPLKPDMLRRNAIQSMLKEVAVAEPWKSLLDWNTSSTTTRVREMLIHSGPLHAPTLSALVNCMPDNYRLSLVGKAMGSESLLSLINNADKIQLKRRVQRCSAAYFEYCCSIYKGCGTEFPHSDFSCLTYSERTHGEREEFYTANGVRMIDHTFPDPVATFTASSIITNSVISPNMQSLRIWDKSKVVAHRSSHLISDRGIYVPRRSGRVWEVTCEHAKGWDTVSQRVAMGLAILARAEADGHRVEGLLTYFIKAWNELSNITPKDTHLISIHGSIKRLDANPGSASHPIIINRNILRGFNNKIKSACDSITSEVERQTGHASHLHDFLAHETSMLCVTALIFSTLQYLGVADSTLSYQIAVRPGCVIAESAERMKTHLVNDMINIEIMDGADNYGLLQACPSLVAEIAIPTMKSSWVKMINALLGRNLAEIDELRRVAYSTPLDELIAQLDEDEVYYSPHVIIAADPAARQSHRATDEIRLAIAPAHESSRATGDSYTSSVRTIGSKFSRVLSIDQPKHIIGATAVRSLIWSRLKSENATALAKILYRDPDQDLAVISRCSSEDFWRGAVTEINRVKAGKALSETVMSSFRSLGVPGLHINSSDDIREVTHSVASYFGANLREVTVIISDLVCAIAGRSSRDYTKPFTERIITNNPSVMNAKMRKEHAKKLVAANIETYRSRIDALKAGTPTHRGDARVIESLRGERTVELRCRMYVYMCVKVMDTGESIIDEHGFAAMIGDCARRVAKKVNIDNDALPPDVMSFERALSYMVDVEDVFVRRNVIQESGWYATSGSLGARLAYQTFTMDAKMIFDTKFAVSPAEVAPKIHRKIIHVPRVEPAVPSTSEPIVPVMNFSLNWGDDEDGYDLMEMTDEDIVAFHTMKGPTITQPYWQLLYTLILKGMYEPDKVNAKLGVHIDHRVSCKSIRESHLEDFTNADIERAFPNVVSDYFLCGTVFDDEWLDRDEADAYTTDEMHTVKGGFLF